VLRSFQDKDTEAIWHRQRSRRLDGPVQRPAWRKLAMLDAAETLTDLRVPTGNRLEKLAGDGAGQYSIRINEIVHGQRRITANTALRLSRYFGTSERFWLNLQARYDLETEKDRLGATLDGIRPLSAAS
jgi:proteic killer suppression protein